MIRRGILYLSVILAWSHGHTYDRKDTQEWTHTTEGYVLWALRTLGKNDKAKIPEDSLRLAWSHGHTYDRKLVTENEGYDGTLPGRRGSFTRQSA